MIKFKTLISEETKSAIRVSWDVFENIGLGMSFTREGLDTKLAVNNSLAEGKDVRFTAGGEKEPVDARSPPVPIPVAIGLGLLAVILGVVAYKVIHEKKKSPIE